MTRPRVVALLTSCLLLAVVGISVPVPASAQQPATPTTVQSVRRLGHPSSRFVAPVRTVDALKRAMARPAIQQDLGAVMARAGLASPVLTEVRRMLAEGQVRETSLAPGTRMEWMANRRRGRPEVMRNLQWAGTTALEGFEFVVDDMDRTYTFFVPEICGNLTLVSSEPSREAARVAEAARAEAARLAAARAAEEARAEAARAAAAKAEAARLAAANAEAERLAAERAAAAEAGRLAAMRAEEARRAEEAARAAEAARQAELDRDLAVRPFAIGFFGRRKGIQRAPGICARCNDAGLKGGVQLRMADAWAFVPGVGIASNLGDGGRAGLVVDLPVNFISANGGYVGAGPSLWDVTRSLNRGTGIVINFGVPVWQSGPRSQQAFVAFEWRQLFTHKSDPADINRQGWAGIKYLFN